jgi:hypothetical protein
MGITKLHLQRQSLSHILSASHCPDYLPLPLKGINTSSPQPDLVPANQLASKISTVITVQKQELPILVTENLMLIKNTKQRMVYAKP